MAAGVDLTGAGGRVVEAIRVDSRQALNDSRPQLSHVQGQAFLRQQWRVVSIIALNSMLNAYLSMNTSAVEAEFAKALSTDREDIAHMYSYFLFTVMIGMTPGMIWAAQHEGSALGFSVLANVLSSWIRLLSLHTLDYHVCLLSTVVNASGAWTILSLPAQISHQRFPPDRGTFTTSLMVQANYIGWLLGAFVPPRVVVRGFISLRMLCLVQAVAATPLLPLFAMFYRPVHPADRLSIAGLHWDVAQSMLGGGGDDRNQPDDGGRSGHAGHLSHSLSDGGFGRFFKVCVGHPTFVMQVLACGLLGGVGFALPSVSVSILTRFGFMERVSAIVNLVFIGTGVLAGLIFGNMCGDPRSYEACLKVLFMCGVICLSACAWLANNGLLRNNENHYLWFMIFMVLSGATGAASIGFIGIGIQAAALYPAGPGYVCWAIEIIIQGLGGGLNLWADTKDGFVYLAVAAAGAAVLIYLSYGCRASRPASDNVGHVL